MADPVVTITMDNEDIMKVELYPQITPSTVNNFISLVDKSFYDGKVSHCVTSGSMIQSGCPGGNSMGGPGYSIEGELSQNGFKNDLKHMAGVLSMARSTMPDPTGSQFFIMHTTSPHLDGIYTGFRKATEGADVVDKIADVQTDYSDRSMKEQRIRSMIVETSGKTYPGPETV